MHGSHVNFMLLVESIALGRRSAGKLSIQKCMINICFLNVYLLFPISLPVSFQYPVQKPCSARANA